MTRTAATPESRPANIVPAARGPAPELAAQIAVMSTQELRAELAAGLRITAEHLLRLGLIVRTLEERGEDLSEMRGLPLLGYLRRIAHGQVVPEAVVRFAEAPGLLQRVSALPLPEQERLARGDPVTLYCRTEGGIDHRLADPLKLTRDQVVQVFGTSRLRDQQEQLLILDSRQSRPEARPVLPPGKARPDRQRNGLVVGRTFVPLADVLAGLAGLRPAPEGEPGGGDEAVEDAQVPVRLTQAEHRHLRVLAAQQGTTMTELIRRAMRAGGILG